jgi:hypothetical protein
MTMQSLLLREIDNERNLIQSLQSIPDLDDLSKNQIRQRVYEEQARLMYLDELEKA